MREAEILLNLIANSDAVLIGAGSGLSSASGYNHYMWTKPFLRYLEPFFNKYGFKSPMDGFYYCFPSLESQWAYYAAYMKAMWDLPTGESYLDLEYVTRGKDRFVLTTNIDMQSERVFKADEIRRFQGDFKFLECKQPCSDEIIESREIINKLYENIDENLTVPSSLVPRCEKCGWTLVPWVRDDTFFEGELWKKEERNHRSFLRRNLIENCDKKLLLLELGVGEMTPSIIKIPFWELTAKNENVFYIEINTEDRKAPEHVKERSLYIKADILDVLRKARMIKEERDGNKLQSN